MVTPKNNSWPIPFVFFFSGCSALIFETVWFRTASLVLGSTIWSAAAVLTAFMVGLAIGNLLVAKFGRFVRYPVIVYAVIEIVIGTTGVSSVFLLPQLSPLVGYFASVLELSEKLVFLRFFIAFLVFLIPAIAMGATLPILQKLLHRYDSSFVSSLGRLYGWNTIGAVCGVLLAEFALIKFFGLKGTSYLTCAINFSAAVILIRAYKESATTANTVNRPRRFSLPMSVKLSLISPLLAGFVLLALEVIWFRYMLLTQIGTSAIFSIMLAIILAGIGMGGLLAARLKSRIYDLDKLLLYVPVLAAFAVIIGLVLFQELFQHFFVSLNTEVSMFALGAIVLMLPTSVISGILFPLYGETVHRKLTDITASSGFLTFVNTIGAAAGSGFATFLLLPNLGIERSILLLALTYFVISAIPLVTSKTLRSNIHRYFVIASGLVLALVIFPFGALENSYAVFARYKLPGEKLIVVREGLDQTLQYYKTERFGEPFQFRLVTNNYSMSATNFASNRYMKLFAYFPYLLHDNIRDTLLISYGVGNTAEALTNLDTLQKLDIVDISSDILALSSIIHEASGKYPLRDARTAVHIEDGRFFLETTERYFDLITGEPPPPKNAGVVNLYTLEYFELLRSRLNPDGITTYWLPAHVLNEQDTLGIIKAFCLAFPDCSLWNGGGLEFMLVGTNGGLGAVRSRDSTEKMTDLSMEFKSIGIEALGQFGALFLADSVLLSNLTQHALAVSDNYPQRISTNMAGIGEYSELYAFLLDSNRRQSHFIASQQVQNMLPEQMIEGAVKYFRPELILTKLTLPPAWNMKILYWVELSYLLTDTKLETIPLLLLDSTPQERRILAKRGDDGTLEYRLAEIKRTLVERRYVEAKELAAATLARIGLGAEQITHLRRLYYFLKALTNDLSVEALSDAKRTYPKAFDESYTRQMIQIIRARES